MTDPEAALRVLAALRRSPVGDSAVLVGSSGLFGFETEAPALTEDIDVAIRAHKGNKDKLQRLVALLETTHG